jgi:uroporphyrinogen III methyltransferase / synthase
MRAFVSLIGAGPGDIGLLTLKAKKRLEQADIVLFDYLANPRLLEFAPHAEHIYVGKKGFSEYISQEEINALIVEKAQGGGGKRIARLKGGDVYVFGRGGEEAEACLHAGIPFEVVPGITSAIAAFAYAGIPITHRSAGSSFAVLTGNEMLRENDTLNYSSYAGIDTLVFLMGVRSLPKIVEKLLEAGRDPTTPVATVQWGTTPQQKVASSTLEGIVAEVQRLGIEAPAVTIVGQVAQYRETLRWFDKLPLFGQTIGITRTREHSSRLRELLEEQGAQIVEVPLIRFEPSSQLPILYRTLSEMANGKYRWVLFSSQQAVDETFRQLEEMGQDSRAFAGVLVASVGPATSRALESHGIRPDFTPSQAGAVHLGQELPAKEGQSILHLTSQLAEIALEQALTARGLGFTRVEAYQTLPAEVEKPALEALKGCSVITLASGSAATAFAEMLGTDFIRDCEVVVMGPQTEEAARKAGFERIHRAKEARLESVVERVLECIKGE